MNTKVVALVFPAILLCAVIAAPVPLHARVGDMSVGGMAGFASSPGYYDWGVGLGFLAAGGYQIVEKMVPRKSDGVEIRGEWGLSYWWKNAYGVSLSLMDMPFTGVGRYVFPINDKFSVFGQAGMGIHYVTVSLARRSCNFYGCGGTYDRYSESDLELGITWGGGCEFRVNPSLAVGADARYTWVNYTWDSGAHLSVMGLLNYYFHTKTAPQ